MRLTIRQTCVPDYRRDLYETLHTSVPGLRVVAGGEFFAPTIRTIADTPPWLVRVRNRFFLGRRLAWLGADPAPPVAGEVLVHELSPRLLSLWRDLLRSRRRGVRFILWGHAWGRGGPRGAAFRFRHWLIGRADGMICYTESQAELVRRMHPGLPVVAAPNACQRADDCGVIGEEADRDAVIYVGRLVREKKVALLLEGYARACGREPAFRARLQLVGDGPERATLERRAHDLGLAKRVEFLGHRAELAALRDAYARAFVSVSPGYVGLSLTLGFGFGVPAVIARGEPHSPEIEAAQEGVNARFFERDDADDLAVELTGAWDEWRGIAEQRQALAAWTAASYSFEKMSDTFVKIISLKNTPICR